MPKVLKSENKKIREPELDNDGNVIVKGERIITEEIEVGQAESNKTMGEKYKAKKA